MACSRRGFLKMAAVAATGACWNGRAATRPSWRQPNVVFFLIDDMGWTDLECFGSSFYETPHIDRLAARGTRFTNAYAACPVCSPTRASIMTGKYPARLNLTDWIPGSRRGKLIPADYVHQLPFEEVTLGEAFGEAGYATCFVGKWHLGHDPYLPEQQGFGTSIAADRYGSPASYFYPYERRGRQIPGIGGGGEKGEYLTDRLTDEAIGFIDAYADEPFLLFLSHYAVHTPLQAKPELVEKYEKKAAALPPPEGTRFIPEGDREARQVQDHAVYAAMVESVDDSVGRILARLDALGLTERTIVVFMSDNGGLSTSEGSPTSNVPLRAGKGWLYEGGIREPMLIAWPSMLPAGRTCAAPVTSTDFYPTLLELAGAPMKPEQHCDGVSLVPLLKQTGPLERDAVFWHYPHYGNQGGSPGGAVRCGAYKLIEFYEDGRVELYNLEDDLGEQHDLASAMPEKARELQQRLTAWRKAVDAQMPLPNPDAAAAQ